VLTAHDLSSEERRQLKGHVETILQKASDSREVLLEQLRDLLDDYVVPRALLDRKPKSQILESSYHPDG
jgi:hypothetical protein